jgi:hypothetical protein
VAWLASALAQHVEDKRQDEPLERTGGWSGDGRESAHIPCPAHACLGAAEDSAGAGVRGVRGVRAEGETVRGVSGVGDS